MSAGINTDMQLSDRKEFPVRGRGRVEGGGDYVDNVFAYKHVLVKFNIINH